MISADINSLLMHRYPYMKLLTITKLDWNESLNIETEANNYTNTDLTVIKNEMAWGSSANKIARTPVESSSEPVKKCDRTLGKDYGCWKLYKIVEVNVCNWSRSKNTLSAAAYLKISDACQSRWACVTHIKQKLLLQPTLPLYLITWTKYQNLLQSI